MERFGTVKLFHPEVSDALFLPVLAFDENDRLNAQAAYDSVSAYLAAGFLPSAPNMEPGEEAGAAGVIVQRQKKNGDGSITPLIDFYLAGDVQTTKFKYVSWYLNTREQAQEFEQVTGLKLRDLPIFRGKGALEKSDDQFGDFAVALPRPIKVIRKANPKYVEGSKEIAKWFWVGFAGVRRTSEQEDAPALTAQEVARIKERAGELGLTKEEVGSALSIVTSWGEWKRGMKAALAVLEEAAAAQAGKASEQHGDDEQDGSGVTKDVPF